MFFGMATAFFFVVVDVAMAGVLDGIPFAVVVAAIAIIYRIFTYLQNVVAEGSKRGDPFQIKLWTIFKLKQ